uniref:Uncharacterized protein n=1 Tax=Lactuca sativa TaxID=4236 RepID=A0A9R1WM53_LACSA|nr:hypothetical protein LSAT_V11C100013620 [Lactuca sativa]
MGMFQKQLRGRRISSSQSSLPGQDQAGPSKFQTVTNSWKSRFNAISMRYKEPLLKSTRGLKDGLFNKSLSMSNIGLDDRREVNAEIESVSQMMESLETHEHKTQDHDHDHDQDPASNDNNTPVASN